MNCSIKLSVTAFFYFAFLTILFSQNNSDDKVNKLYNGEIDSVKIDLLINMAKNFAKKEKYDSAHAYIDKAIEQSEQLGDIKRLARSFDNKGSLYRKQGQYDKALDIHFQALELAKKENYLSLLANINNNIGVTYRRKSEDNKALVYHLKALEIAEKIQDTRNLSFAYNSLGIIYTYQKNYDDALNYYTKAMELAKKRNNMIGIAINYNSLAWLFQLKYDYTKAIEYYNLALEINIKMDNFKGIAICYTDLGKIYHSIGEYEKSLVYYKKTLEINKKDNDKRFIARSRIYLGEVYADMGNYQQSLIELKKGIEYAVKLKTKRLLKDGYKLLANTYEKIGDFEKAFKYFQLSTLYNDSIYNEDNSRQIAEFKTLYETEKKEKEIELQKIELNQKENKIKQRVLQRNIFIAGSIILMLVLIITIRIYLQNKKVNKILVDQKDEIKKQAEKLDQANKEIVKNTKLKELFFANTSHEIRSPVNIIVGFTNLLLNSELSQKQKNYLKNIKNTGINLLAIVNDILDFSKLEAGKLEIDDIEFNFRRKIKSIYNIMQLRANQKKLDMSLNVSDDIPGFVTGDPLRLNQILTNLITNALKFTDKGEINITAKLVSLENNKANIKITVTDTGIGIPEEKLKTIFQSYSQAFDETSRKFGGTGLGLSIVKNLIDLQDGSLSVESKLSVGSKFSFEIPYKVSDGSYVDDSLENKIKEVRDIRKLNILLVDDNAINRALAIDTIHLYNENIKVDEAENGLIAIDKLKKSSYDLILMDLLMPELDGYEATKIIRNDLDEPLNKIPILGMTAIIEEEERKKCLELGMNEYITKPFDPEDFFVKILSLIGDK